MEKGVYLILHRLGDSIRDCLNTCTHGMGCFIVWLWERGGHGFLFCFLLELFGQHGRVMGSTARASDMGWGGRALASTKTAWLWVGAGCGLVCLGRGGGTAAMRTMYISGRMGGGDNSRVGGRGLAEAMRRSKYIGGHIETFEDFQAVYVAAVKIPSGLFAFMRLLMCLLGLVMPISLGRVREEGVEEGVCVLVFTTRPGVPYSVTRMSESN